MNLPPVVGRLVGDNSDYVRSLKDAESATKGHTDRSSGHFSKLGGVIGTAVKVGTAAAGVAVAGFVVKAISGASDLAETISKVGVVFGDQAKQVTGFANQMAKGFGLPKTQILDAAASIGLIGKASGLSQGDAAKMSTQLAKLAADASSFYNVPLPEALQAIQSGLVGEAEPMRRFGVLLNEQAVSAEAARLGLAKTNGEYSEGAKAQARASLIMRGMTDASGDLERTQGSLANRIRELKGRAENFAASVGSLLVPWLLRAMDAGEQLGQKLGPVFDVLRRGAAQFAEAFSAVGKFGQWEAHGNFERLGVAIAGVVDFIRDNAMPVLAGLGTLVAAALVPSITAAATAVAAFFSPVVLAVAAVAALTAGLVYAYGHWEGFRTVVDGVVGFLTGTVLPAIAAFVAFVAGQFASLVGWVQENWAGISEAIGHAVAVAQAVIEVFVAFVSVLWGAFGDEILAVARVVWDQIRNVVDTVVAIISGIIETGLALINGEWGAAWDGIMGILVAAWDFIRETVVNAFRLLGQYIEGGLSAVLLLVGGLPGRILGALGNLGGLLWDAGINLIEGLIGGIRAMAGRAASAAWDVVKGAVSAAWNALRPGSPSREGAAIGVNFGQGLIAGMAKMRGDVAGAAGSLVAGAISAAGGTGGPTLGGLGGGGAVAAGSAIAATAAGGRSGANYYVTVQIVAPTGDIPDSTIRKFRQQLLAMTDDYPAGSILPAA